MHRVAAVLALVMFLSVGAAAAETVQVTDEVKLKPQAPVTVASGSLTRGKVDLGKRFSSIESVCFVFRFEDDLLDPGERLVLELGPGIGGVIFSNWGTVPLTARIACVVHAVQPESVAAFLDARQEFTITMEPGSVTLGSLAVEVVGSRD